MSSRRTFLQSLLGVTCASMAFPHLLHGRPQQAGTNYYIDPTGDNANPGTSPHKPWADFKNVNSRTFQPNESILLRRGGVWHQQMTLNGAGSPGKFVSIGAYGSGNRPRIEMTGNPSDRCIRLNNASYVRISGLEVCNGGVGILLYYDASYDHQSVYIDDVVAHQFSGVGKANVNPHDRVSWPYAIGVSGIDAPGRDQDRVLSDFRVTNTEIYNAGAGICLDWANHHTAGGQNAGSNKFGDVRIEKANIHDITVDGISFVSLFLSSVTNCTVKNSTINRGAHYAPTGTSAIQLMYTKKVTLDTVTVNNTDLCTCPDNSAIDFECDNEDTLIDNCTFKNNAGPAIEFLATPGYPNAFSRNFEIRNSTFQYNNSARKLGPYHIVVENWQKGNTPDGYIHDNTYVNVPGVEFFGGDGNLEKVRLARNRSIG